MKIYDWRKFVLHYVDAYICEFGGDWKEDEEY